MHQQYGHRFTPTGVGTIGFRANDTTRVAVHPQGRGDNPSCGCSPDSALGSPPRAWGQFPPAPARSTWRRFTPTGVGTIAGAPPRLTRCTVHPHGRGDNRWGAAKIDALHGSPPRAWGQCARAAAVPVRRRFTPTGVGTIVARGINAPSRPVHPHGRGDNVTRYARRAVSVGSPPRAWGQFAHTPCPPQE